MAPLSVLGLRTHFIQDLLSELPGSASSARDFQFVASKFDPGMLAPLSVVLESDTDFRGSEGLALIDDVSRLLSHQRRLSEVRSATQPLGSPQPLDRARLASRLGEVNAGFHQIADGAGQLQKGLTAGAAKLRAAIWLEEKTGLTFTAKTLDRSVPKSDDELTRAHSRETLASGLKQASAVLQWSQAIPSGWNLPALNRAFEAIGDQSRSSAPSSSAAMSQQARGDETSGR
jgi:RND superfamily putative drug exporter